MSGLFIGVFVYWLIGVAIFIPMFRSVHAPSYLPALWRCWSWPVVVWYWIIDVIEGRTP